MSKKLKFSEVLEEVEKSHEFKKFKRENKNAYLSAGFFVLDFEAGNEMKQLDFATEDKIFTFYLGDKIQVKEEEKLERELNKLSLGKELKVDLWNLKDYVENEIELKQINKKIMKIIAVLQINDDVLKWNLTCMLDGFKLLKVHIDALTGNFLFSETLNIFDFMKFEKKGSEGFSMPDED